MFLKLNTPIHPRLKKKKERGKKSYMDFSFFRHVSSLIGLEVACYTISEQEELTQDYKSKYLKQSPLWASNTECGSSLVHVEYKPEFFLLFCFFSYRKHFCFRI